MNFHARRSVDPDVMGDCALSHGTTFLGIHLDNKLSFDTHIEHVCKNLNKSYFALLKLKASLEHDAMLDAYYALCHSRISYGCLLWGRAREWQRVFISQKRIVRLLFGLPSRESCREYFKQHSILTFPSLYVLKAVLYVRQNYDSFPKHVRHYNTRDVGLPLVRHRTALFQKSPRYDFVKLYNKLPGSIAEITDFKHFKRKVKQLLIGGGYYSRQEYLDDTF